MLVSSLWLVLGLAVLFAGAQFLVRGAASLALRLGLTPLVVGLTVVAFGTSAPELVVSIGAALKDQGDIAVGNVVGSNIFNIAVILGLTAVICPIRVALPALKVDAPIMVVLSAVLALLATGGTIGRWTGAGLLLALVVYTSANIVAARRQATAAVKHEFEEGVPHQTRALWMDLLEIFGGLGLLVLGSRWLVSGAVSIAQALGVSEAVIALTIVAAGTSTPELATSAVAALRRQPDIAIGNVIGSNIFNILCILGAGAVVRPLFAPGIAALDLWVMTAFAVGLVPLLWTSRKLQRAEGALLLAGYLLYLWARWPAAA